MILVGDLGQFCEVDFARATCINLLQDIICCDINRHMVSAMHISHMCVCNMRVFARSVLWMNL